MHRRIPFWPTMMLAALVLSACGPQGAATPSPEPAVLAGDAGLDCISVPVARAPKLDGSMEPGEWDEAVSSAFADGSEMLLVCGGGSLHVGIRGCGQEMIAGNVFVNTGAEVTILHTSAALGTAKYQQSSAGWQQGQDFVWRIRRRSLRFLVRWASRPGAFCERCVPAVVSRRTVAVRVGARAT